MDEQDKNSTFTYYKVGRSARIFPIDYSDNEFAALAGCDVRTARRVIENSCFESILNHQLCAPESESELNPDSPQTIPIPVEAAKLLSVFYQTTQKDPEYRKLIKKDANVSEHTKQQFASELCNALYQQIISDSDTPAQTSVEFYRRSLFHNDAFNRAVLKNIWEKQLYPKYETLRNLAQQVPFEMQAQVLLDCLQRMDSAIFYLSSQPQNCPKETQKAEQELQGMLEQLLSGRVRKRSGGNSQAVYQVYNSQVDESTSMERAFRALNAPGSNQVLMRASRDAYLRHLTEKLSPSPMEDAYKTLHDYLVFTECELTEEELTSCITERCRQYGKQVIDDVTFSPFKRTAFVPLTGERTYLTDLVDWTIQSQINDLFQNVRFGFQETMQVIRYLNAAQDFFRQHQWREILMLTRSNPEGKLIQKDGVNDVSRGNRQYFCVFSQYLQNACSVLYPDGPAVRDSESGRIISQTWLAERLSQDGLAAAQFFDKKDLLEAGVSSYQPEDIFRTFDMCNDYISDEQACPPMEHVLQMIPNIMTGVLCQILKRIVDDSIPDCLDSVLTFYMWLRKANRS